MLAAPCQIVNVRYAVPTPRQGRLPRLACGTRIRAGNSDFEANVRKVLKKVQGSLPIIGLVSRLATPEGGFDEVSHMEFGRTMFDTMGPDCRSSISLLDKKYGKYANTKWLFMILWMAKYGSGVVPLKDIVNAAKRIRYSQDVEVEVERFEGTRREAAKKYQFMEIPEGTLRDKLTVSIDALGAMVFGLKDGESPSAEDSAMLAGIIKAAFPEADVQLIRTLIQERSQRAAAYS